MTTQTVVINVSPWVLEWWNARPNMGWPGRHDPHWDAHPNTVTMGLVHAIAVAVRIRDNAKADVRTQNMSYRLRNVDTEEIIMADVL